MGHGSSLAKIYGIRLMTLFVMCLPLPHSTVFSLRNYQTKRSSNLGRKQLDQILLYTANHLDNQFLNTHPLLLPIFYRLLAACLFIEDVSPKNHYNIHVYIRFQPAKTGCPRRYKLFSFVKSYIFHTHHL